METLKNWNKNNSERVKLQHAYAVFAVAILLVAGVVGLINIEIGQQLLVIAFGLTILFFANAVAWAVLKSFVLDRMPRTSPTSRKK